MRRIRNYFGLIIVSSAIMIFVLHIAIWNLETKLFLSEDVIRERLIGATFIEKNNDDRCVIVTNKNIVSLEYTLSPHFDMAIGKPGDNHICNIDFEMVVNNGRGDYYIKGTLVLRYNSDDGRKWVCEKLHSEDYDTHHLNWNTVRFK